MLALWVLWALEFFKANDDDTGTNDTEPSKNVALVRF